MPIKAKWIPFTHVVMEALSIGEAGVYEIGKARGNIVLYIGKSDTSIRDRLRSHKRETRFRGCTHFRKRRTSPSDAKAAEDRLTSAYAKLHGDKLPPLNKVKPSDDQWRGILY